MADFSAKHYQIKSEKNATRAEEAADRAESYATQAKNYAIRAENSLLPNQTGNAGKVLLTNGSAPYWGEFKQSSHQVVSVLPVEPEEDVFYYIPE